jgi:HEAT repeat protein
VAALGALGDEAGLPAILTATQDKPAVRRRAVLALAPFQGPAVDAALQRALGDHDWQVRQAAEDLLS